MSNQVWTQLRGNRSVGKLPVLNAVAVPESVRLCVSPIRRLEVETAMDEARASFDGIEYELDERSRTANAQAYARPEARIVRMYGGLTFHPSIGINGLVFALLHETRHHLAGGRRVASDSLLACDCTADPLAVTVGAQKVPIVTRR